MKVTLPLIEIQPAAEFARAICKGDYQSAADFSRLDLIRGLDARYNDCFHGKLAEIAFCRFLQDHWGLPVAPDLTIYPSQAAIDYGQDLAWMPTGFCRARIDVKASKPRSLWLLVDREKFQSDAYVFVRIHLDSVRLEDPGPEPISILCEVCGFAYYHDFISRAGSPHYLHQKGSCLYDPDSGRPIGGTLYRDNIGVPLASLRRTKAEWDAFAEWIQASGLPATPPSENGP